MGSARTKRCEPCSAIHERMRLQLRDRSLVKGLERGIRKSLRSARGWDFIKGKIGYDVATLRSHIERQFRGGMDWAALARGEIHIDHIVPLRVFDLTRESEVLAAFALTNLRPMWAKDNLKKGGKVQTML